MLEPAGTSTHTTEIIPVSSQKAAFCRRVGAAVDTGGTLGDGAFTGKRKGRARLNSGVGATNTFTLRFQRGLVSASVNQKTILAQVAAPKTRNLNTNVFWLGVGAYHDMNQTTIRYRDVQVRRLAER